MYLRDYILDLQIQLIILDLVWHVVRWVPSSCLLGLGRPEDLSVSMRDPADPILCPRLSEPNFKVWSSIVCSRYLLLAKPIFSTLLPTENNMWRSCVQPHKTVRLRWILSYFPPRWESGVIAHRTSHNPKLQRRPGSNKQLGTSYCACLVLEA